MICLEIPSVGGLSSVILAFLPTVLPLVMVIMLLDFNEDFSIFSLGFDPAVDGFVPFVVGFELLVVGFIPLVVGFASLILACALLVGFFATLAVGFAPLVVGFAPLVVSFVPLVVGFDPLVVGFVPLVIVLALVVVGVVPLVVRFATFVVGFVPLVVDLDKGCLAEVVIGADLVVADDLPEIDEDALEAEEAIFLGRNGTPLCFAVALASVGLGLVGVDVGLAVGGVGLDVAGAGFGEGLAVLVVVMVGFDVAEEVLDVDVESWVDEVFFGVVGLEGLFADTFRAEGIGPGLVVAGTEFLRGAATGLVVFEDMLGVEDFLATNNGLPS